MVCKSQGLRFLGYQGIRAQGLKYLWSKCLQGSQDLKVYSSIAVGTLEAILNNIRF